MPSDPYPKAKKIITDEKSHLRQLSELKKKPVVL